MNVHTPSLGESLNQANRYLNQAFDICEEHFPQGKIIKALCRFEVELNKALAGSSKLEPLKFIPKNN